MSDSFFRELGLPTPDINLEVGSGSHAVQTATMLPRLEKALIENSPDILVVYGDVNSTLAAALVAAKIGIRIAHVEAGLRSFDRTMPEEINRMIADRVSDVLFTPSADADENLLREGMSSKAIHRVGNVMIDSVVACLPKTDGKRSMAQYGLARDASFVLATLHRAASVDDGESLACLLKALATLATEIPVLFPVHPRTSRQIRIHRINCGGVRLLEPLGYLEFLGLLQHARVVLTDSGGVQHEASFLGIPCVTARDTTEWTVTVTHGTNVLVGRDPDRLLAAARAALGRPPAERTPLDLWDGRTAERIATVLMRELQ